MQPLLARLAVSGSQAREASALLSALVEVLGERGLIDAEELDRRKHVVAQRLAEQNSEQGLGVMLQDPFADSFH